VIEIRPVGAGEEGSLRELRLRAMRDAPGAFASTAEQEAAHPQAHWSQLAGQSQLADAMVVFVATDGDRWLAMAAGRWFDRERGIAALWGMWVDPVVRRLGIGERLVAEARRWAASRDARFLRLGLTEGTGGASSFYERLGFVRTGETRPLPRDPSITAVFLVRPV
jgi:ribosomal protein S18 acetylase RimI-like enzyme